LAGPDVPIEKLYEKTQSVYKLVILASRRALELNAGAPHLVENPAKAISITALQEIAEGKVNYKAAKPEKAE
jgi:DNA-directed RNA polymerase omega subunit